MHLFLRLQEIQNSQESDESKQSASTTDGIATLIRTLGDESLADKILVKIPSLSVVKQDAPPIFLIAGIEGRSTVFNNLCSKLKPVTYALQLGFELECDTIKLMAESLYKVITSNISPAQDFNIVAYSYGSLVALELAVLLEASGYKGRLLFIDGAPSIFTSLFQLQMASGITESQLQSTLLCGIMNIIAPINLLELRVRIKKHARIFYY